MHKSLATRILGIDFGLKRIGLALSDETKILASPLPNLIAEKKVEKTVEKLKALIDSLEQERRCKIEKVVIGYPLMMSGKTGFLADEVNFFISAFEKISDIPIVRWDERLTTCFAERTLRQTSLSRKKRSQIVDSVSAVIILQNFLDQDCFK